MKPPPCFRLRPSSPLIQETPLMTLLPILQYAGLALVVGERVGWVFQGGRVCIIRVRLFDASADGPDLLHLLPGGMYSSV